MPDAWLFMVAGFHVPVTPLDEVVGNAGTVPPAQMVIAVPNANVGMMFGLTVSMKLAGNAHKPAVGVKM